MRAIGLLLLATLFGALGVWDFYAIWTGFAGGRLWPFGWELPGGLWHGLLFTMFGLPALWLLGWLLLALLLTALQLGRKRG